MLIQRIRPYLSNNWTDLCDRVANWGLVLLGLFAVRGAGALAQILIARRVSPIEYGQYISSYGLASFLIVLPNYGLEPWLLTSGYSTISEIIDLWSNAIRVRIYLLLIWIAGMMLLGILLPSKTFPFAIIGPTILGVAFDSVVFLSYTALRCLDQHSKITLLQFASSLALIGIAWAVPIGNGNIESFAIGRAILSAISLAVTITIIGKHYFGHPIPSKPALDVLQSAHPFMVAELASSVYVKADLMIVSLVLGSVGASIYGPALNLLQATFLIPRALYLLTVPMLSRGHTRDHQSFLRRSLTLLATQSVVGAGLSLGVYLVTPIAIRSVFGSAYQSSAEILYRLSPIPFLRSLNFALAAMLASGNRQPQRTRIQMLCAVFSVSANLTVVYVFGLKSVPIVYVFSELILCLGYLLIARDWLSQEITKVGIY